MPKRGRPPIPPDQRRVTLAVRVRPETKTEVAWLAKVSLSSMGDIVDLAVRGLVEQPQTKAKAKRKPTAR